MAVIVLGVGIFALLTISLLATQDLLAPCCLVCESFLLAYVSAIFSSQQGGWLFSLHYPTVVYILMALIFFISGSLTIRGRSIEMDNKQSRIDIISLSPKLKITMLIIQVFLFAVYVFFFRRSGLKFANLAWQDMMRERRFATAYGAGLDDQIPGFVDQLTKIMRVNAYIAIYYIAHNLAVHSIEKTKKFKFPIIMIVITMLFLFISILKSARFDIMIAFLSGILIWYIYYQHYSKRLNINGNNIGKIMGIMTTAVIGMAAVMSFLGPLVGRLSGATLFSDAFNYMGRTIQALDEYIQLKSGLAQNEVRGAETFYGVFKFLSQLGLVDMSGESWYLEFVSQNGISLGNTYTAVRRYYRDFGVLGIMILPLLEGIIITKIYNCAQAFKNAKFSFWTILYSMVGPYMFLYAYEGFFFANVLSANYFIIFAIAFITCKVASDQVYLEKPLKLIIVRNK